MYWRWEVGKGGRTQSPLVRDNSGWPRSIVQRREVIKSLSQVSLRDLNPKRIGLKIETE